MTTKRKRAVRVYRNCDTYWVYGRGKNELWHGDTHIGSPMFHEKSCLQHGLHILTGPALAAWLRSHPKPKGKK